MPNNLPRIPTAAVVTASPTANLTLGKGEAGQVAGEFRRGGSSSNFVLPLR